MKLHHLWLSALLGFTAMGGGTSQLSAQTSETVYDLSVVDKAPEPKKRIKPDYPASIRRRETPAEITLRFIVTAEGKVTEINIVKFNDPDMVDPVYGAYENAKYIPGEKAGKPVNTRMEITEIYPEPKAPKKKK